VQEEEGEEEEEEEGTKRRERNEEACNFREWYTAVESHVSRDYDARTMFEGINVYQYHIKTN